MAGGTSGEGRDRDREEPIDEALADYLQRVDAGEQIDPEAFIAQYPELEGSLREFFNNLRGVNLLVAAAPGNDDPSEKGPLRDPSPPSQRDTDSLLASDAPETDHPRETDRDQPEPIRERIGRFQIERLLGSGGFGSVYLARDMRLDRQVALKVPRAGRFSTPREIERLMEEARAAAQLNHPGLVTIHDVGRDGQRVFIVQAYIAGTDLGDHLKRASLPLEEIAELTAQVAEAMSYAHQKGFVHRDLKPGNILLDEHGRPHVADFGLAVHETLQRRRKGERSGTPAYMSPEQVRGETHRLDGRSDIWSLGVMLYEMLSGRRPFAGATTPELFDEIEHRDPRPPRQTCPHVPTELERICLKCLAKRAVDRYSSATDLVVDLRQWLAEQRDRQPQVAAGTPGRIVPKGLRSFDAEDADFYLDLLPGPRDRDGLPESIRFWKTRIESTDAEGTFSVGLIYGPSGCGKSSLIKAGLLPRLANHVVPVYLEAAPADTELRLLQGLRRRFTAIPPELTLPEVLAGIREGSWVPERTKVCVVLDQFEQWLHARRGDQDTQLVQALRHCDGVRLQCVVLVRDDFWLAASRFSRTVEVEFLPGKNSALVDLFDPCHAHHVLAAFGRAYGRLPEGAVELTAEQQQFLDRAVAGLALDGKIICVRLALFADMLKGKPWTTATLAQVGGTEGLGVTFLEETFSSSTAPAAHRHHQRAAQSVLKTLLPEAGSDIKGSRQSYEALLDASGYSHRPDDFRELIRILDSEIRLITPTDPEGMETGEERSEKGEPRTHSRQDSDPSRVTLLASPFSLHYYQLTHDYLVPSLRDWLTRKQKETCSGRAELQLAERSALWNTKPENQQLPSWWEDLSIRWLTDHGKWTEPQRRMMRRSRRVYGLRAALAASLILVLLWSGFEIYGRFQADKVLAADPATLPSALAQLSPWQIWARQYVRSVAQREDPGAAERREQLHARLAYADATGTYDPRILDALYQCDTRYVSVVRDVLEPHREQVTSSLWDTLHNTSQPDNQRFRAGVALAQYAPDSEHWSAPDFAFLARQLVMENPIHQPLLWPSLQPVSRRLIPELEKLFAYPGLPETQQIGAANALAVYCRDDGHRLARLLADATPGQYKTLFPLVSDWSDGTVKSVLSELVDARPTEDLTQQERVALGRQRAGAAISLLRLGEVKKSHGAFDIQDDPESLTQFVHRCRDREVQANELVSSLQQTNDVRSRFALLLALGDYPLTAIDDSRRDSLVRELVESYAEDPSSAIHGATGWLLRQWGFAEEVTKVDHTPLPYDETGQREWFVREIPPQPTDVTGATPGPVGGPMMSASKLHFTFVVFQPDKILMGSPEGEDGRQADERQHQVQLTRPLAVSMHEVTWQQYDPVDRGQTHAAQERRFERNLGPTDPAFGVNWFEAVEYCRWLTLQSQLSEADQCYDDPQSLPKDAEGNPQYPRVRLDRRGFRLPTEAEWEYVCRFGMTAAYSFGNDPGLLPYYGWFLDNAEQWSHAVGQLRPNARGLFDIHGNLYEWCHDWYESGLSARAVDPIGAEGGSSRVLRGGSWDYPAAYLRTVFRNHNLPAPHERHRVSAGPESVWRVQFRGAGARTRCGASGPRYGGSVCGAAGGNAVACGRSGD